jgi:hypothetical protein
MCSFYRESKSSSSFNLIRGLLMDGVDEEKYGQRKKLTRNKGALSLWLLHLWFLGVAHDLNITVGLNYK